jgi:arginyl-tRNA synthetase
MIVGTWQDDTDPSAAAMRDLSQLPQCHKIVQVNSDGLGITLDREWHASMGAQLESGVLDACDSYDLARGRQVVIHLCNPNATKALHVGHLRNVAVGHALARLLTSAGAKVVTEMHAGDAGRSMGEALAGYVQFGGGQTPSSSMIKGDQLVGRYYSRYVESQAERPREGNPGPGDSALSREADEWDDAAEQLLERLAHGDRDTEGRWRQLRGWVVDGQLETLAGLGITIQRVLFESDSRDAVARIEAALLEAGIVERLPSGATVYATGGDAYRYLVLRRGDGFPTQHLRFLARWNADAQLYADAESLQVIGAEWEPLTVYGKEMIERLDDPRFKHPRGYVTHGMVSIADTVVKSSNTEIVLIDDLLDWLSTSSDVRAIAAQHARVGVSEIVAIVALGFWLGRPMRKGVSLCQDALLDPKENAGWAMARAWVKAWHPRYDGDAAPQVDDPSYRFLVTRSQRHRPLVRACVADLDTLMLARFYGHLSRWFLTTTPTPPRARVMRTMLRAGLTTLGLSSPGRPSALSSPTEGPG